MKMKGNRIELPKAEKWEHDFMPFYCFLPNGKVDKLIAPYKGMDIDPRLMYYIKCLEDRIDDVADMLYRSHRQR